MIPQIQRGGGSFAGVMAYLTHDAGTADNPRPKTTARVGFTEVENLVPCSPARAGRIMAATVRDAEALKRLAGVSSRGRRLQKPVYHFSLSWAPDENPDQPTMVGAVLDSLRVLGMRHHQAAVIEHRDREHPHVHVVVNRVSPEDGRAASTSNDARHLSRWAADWELQHGGIRCRGRVDREHDPERQPRVGPGRRQRSPEDRKPWAELFAQQDYERGEYFHQYSDTPPGFDDDLIEAGALELAERQARERAELSRKQARAARIEALGPGGRDLYRAHLADLDPAWARGGHNTPTRQNTNAALDAAESDTPRLERLHGVLSDEATAARYRKVLGKVLGKVAGRFNTADLDQALAAGEREREERAAALKAATEATLAEAARSGVKLHAAGVHAIYETGATHEAGIAAVERTARALGAAADQELPTKTIINTWNVSPPDRRAEALEAAVRREEERKETAKRQATLEAATEATLAEAARSGVKLHAAGVHAIYETGATHEAGIAAVERTARALGAAADQQLSEDKIIETWNANPPDRQAEALEAVTAADREEQERKAAERAERQQRWKALETFPGAQAAARAQFDRLEPGRTENDVSAPCFGRVLDAIEQRVPKSLDDREARRRKGPDYGDYNHARHYDQLLERVRRKVLGESAPERGALTQQQRAQVLDTADLLDGVERVVVYAQRTGEELLGEKIPPAHDTVRTALRKVAADASHDDPRSKQIADIAASSPIDYPDPGIAGERAAIEQHCIKADRRRADLEAAQQHQKALDVWNARSRATKAFTCRPERQDPEGPAPPTQARIDEYRQQTLIERIVKTIRDVLNHFLNRELVPADRAAASAFNEQPHEREQRNRNQDQGHYHGR